MTNSPVVRSTAEHVPQLIELLGRSFDEDPVVNWFLRQDSRRAQEPHRCQTFLGTHPDHHGQGLLETMLHQSDTKGAPAYLENTNTANLAFYESHGFMLTEAIPLPGRDAPPRTSMWRAVPK